MKSSRIFILSTHIPIYRCGARFQARMAHPRGRLELEEQPPLADPRFGHRRDDLPASRLRLRASRKKIGDETSATPPVPRADTSEADLKWILPGRLPQSVKCAETAPGDPFRQFADRARHEPGWRYYEIDASHWRHVHGAGGPCRVASKDRFRADVDLDPNRRELVETERLFLRAPEQGKIDPAGEGYDGQILGLAAFNNRFDYPW
jgi:hypothetical protein